jgi:protein TilB
MDSSLVDIDLQPKYVRVTMKGKVLQLALSEEVKCDQGIAQRSQTTGVLSIKMPKQNPILRSTKKEIEERVNKKETVQKEKKNEYLEVDDKKKIDYKNILKEKNVKDNKMNLNKQTKCKIRENSPDFVDDPDVPPLI